jgi:hypothetical protein
LIDRELENYLYSICTEIAGEERGSYLCHRDAENSRGSDFADHTLTVLQVE